MDADALSALPDEMRLLYMAEKAMLDRALAGEIKRQPEWVKRQRQIIEAVSLVGAVIIEIARNPEGFINWVRIQGGPGGK